MSDEPRELSFKEKLKSINFGMVPGAARESASTTMYDRDALLEQIGDSDGSKFSKERVLDTQSTVMRKIREFTAE